MKEQTTNEIIDLREFALRTCNTRLKHKAENLMKKKTTQELIRIVNERRIAYFDSLKQLELSFTKKGE